MPLKKYPIISNKLTAPELLAMSGILRTRDLENSGISRQQLSRLTREGVIVRLGRGIYSLPDSDISRHHSLAEICTRIPHCIICLTSALEFHGLTTQVPSRVTIMIEKHARSPKIEYPPIQCVRARGFSFSTGVQTHTIEGVSIHITDPYKTVVDCFKYRNKIGMDIAIEALREILVSPVHEKDSLNIRTEIRHYAQICRVEQVMRPYLEALS